MSQHFVALSTVRAAWKTALREPKGDISERLSSHVTSGLLILLSAVLLTSHYWGEPIHCWVRCVLKCGNVVHIRRCPLNTHSGGWPS